MGRTADSATGPYAAWCQDAASGPPHDHHAPHAGGPDPRVRGKDEPGDRLRAGALPVHRPELHRADLRAAGGTRPGPGRIQGPPRRHHRLAGGRTPPYTPMAMDLDGASVLLTGGSRGLGPYIARALQARGGPVTLAARSADDLDRVRGSLDPDRVAVVTGDVTNEDERTTMVAAAP